MCYRLRITDPLLGVRMKRALALIAAFVLAWVGWALFIDSHLVRFLVAGAAIVLASVAVAVAGGLDHDT
jgi:hypothetical protein